MKTLVTCLFVSAGVLAGAGNALASEALAKKYNCLACHAADKKLIGPSYAEIAAKYKGDAGAEAKLIAKVKNGGAGLGPGSDAAQRVGAGSRHQDTGEMGVVRQEVAARRGNE